MEITKEDFEKIEKITEGKRIQAETLQKIAQKLFNFCRKNDMDFFEYQDYSKNRGQFSWSYGMIDENENIVFCSDGNIIEPSLQNEEREKHFGGNGYNEPEGNYSWNTQEAKEWIFSILGKIKKQENLSDIQKYRKILEELEE